VSPRHADRWLQFTWTAEEAAALLRRGFTAEARSALLAELEALELDYPAWETFVTIDGCFRAINAANRGGRARAGDAYEADTPRELRSKLARHYSVAVRTPEQRYEGNTL
jgi:hypothetical protein